MTVSLDAVVGNRGTLIISTGIVLFYVVCGWAWFMSSCTGSLGWLLFLPYVLAYGAGYAIGDAAFYGVLTLGLVVIWLFTYGIVRAIRGK